MNYLIFLLLLIFGFSLVFSFKKLYEKVNERLFKTEDVVEAKLSANNTAIANVKREVKELKDNFDKEIDRKNDEITMLQQIPVAVYVKENIQYIYEEIDDFKQALDVLKEHEQYYQDSVLTDTVRQSRELLEKLKDFKQEIDTLVTGGEGDVEE